MSGFTLVELVVCIAIFAMMTALVVAKYGTFNQSVLLTDLAYDTAITIRTAETYGVSVQSADKGDTSFNYAYGVEFCSTTGASGCGSVSSVNLTNNLLVLFADVNGNSIYSTNDLQQSLYTITRGAVISGFCLVTDCTSPDDTTKRLDITFKRPNPDAIICINGTAPCSGESYAAIFIKGTDGSIRKVIVRSTGQVSVPE
jgi:prepilin-type N-terminal cleavage/methylation domain-containing protein